MNTTRQGPRVIPFDGSPEFGVEPSVIIFDHINKCAGTTFRRQLEKSFACYFDFAFIRSWTDHAKALSACSADRVAIAGHAALGSHELLPPSYQVYYITVLRHPVDRFVSTYRFRKAWYYPYRSLSEHLNMVQPNYLVHRIGNGSLQLAKERLLSFYYLFGLVERFDDFLELLTLHTGIDFMQYESLNRTQPATAADHNSIIDQFVEKNQADMDLFTWASAEFQKRWEDRQPTPRHVASLVPPTHGKNSFLRSYPDVIEHIECGRFTEAATLLESRLPAHNFAEQFSIQVAVATLYELAGNIDQAAEAHRRSRLMEPERAIAEAAFLQKNARPNASVVLLNAIDALAPIQSRMPDSALNRCRQGLWTALFNIHDEKGHPRFGIEAIENRVRSIWEELGKMRPALKVAVVGAGRHTAWLQGILRDTAGPKVVAVLDDQPAFDATFWGLSPVPIFTWNPKECDVIVLSSDTCVSALERRCRALFGDGIRLVQFYEGLPPGPYPKAGGPAI